MKYNTPPVKIQKYKKLYEDYQEDVKAGWISPIFGFDNYLNLYLQLENKIVGTKTKDGIEITGISRHFLQRVIGTARDPKIYKEEHKIEKRNGVPVNDLLQALTIGNSKKSQYDNVKKEWSKLYVGDRCKVTINPITGNLIQCNINKGK